MTTDRRPWLLATHRRVVIATLAVLALLDLRAVIAFLRAMPPVKNRVPADRAPAADDCEVYTFWTSESHEPGCR
jgi:hypothetical protein